MTYPGGKNGAGVYQRLINLMPPHNVYIEPFLGGAAIMRLKRPALQNFGIDRDQRAIDAAGEWIQSPELASAAGIGAPGESSSRPFPVDPPNVTHGVELLEIRPFENRSRSRQPGRSTRKAMRAGSPSPGAALLEDRQEWRDGLRPPESARDFEAAARAENGDTRSLAAIRCMRPTISLVRDRAHYSLYAGDGIQFLQEYPFHGGELVYCDPPYVRSTRRTAAPLYTYEMDDAQHAELIATLKALPCYVMISGYRTKLYAGELSHWNVRAFECMTRGGRLATEWLWFNFNEPPRLHDYRYLGENFRERERIKRKKRRWTERLAAMPTLERQALMSALEEVESAERGRPIASHCSASTRGRPEPWRLKRLHVLRAHSGLSAPETAMCPESGREDPKASPGAALVDPKSPDAARLASLTQDFQKCKAAQNRDTNFGSWR